MKQTNPVRKWNTHQGKMQIVCRLHRAGIAADLPTTRRASILMWCGGLQEGTCMMMACRRIVDVNPPCEPETTAGAP
jgi:hypothetical protein